MINSRDISELIPVVRTLCTKHIQVCKEVGIDIIVTSTYRDEECQDALYAQGRTKPGKIVTNARAGESFHNFRVAYDVVVLRNGKPVWDTSDKAWAAVGRLGEEVGLTWAGRWTGKLKEMAHFQLTGVDLASLRTNPPSLT